MLSPQEFVHQVFFPYHNRTRGMGTPLEKDIVKHVVPICIPFPPFYSDSHQSPPILYIVPIRISFVSVCILLQLVSSFPSHSLF